METLRVIVSDDHQSRIMMHECMDHDRLIIRGVTYDRLCYWVDSKKRLWEASNRPVEEH